MCTTYRCVTGRFVTSLAIALSFLVFTGLAFAAPVTAAAVPGQDPPDDAQMLPPVQLNRQEINQLLLRPDPESGNRSYLALVDTAASAKPGKTLRPVLSWETGEAKSYLIPALEIPGFIVALNIFDRFAFPDRVRDGKEVYSSTASSTWEHLRRQNWDFDKDSFDVNQFGHPYEGATMFGAARSSGLNFWQSLVYSNVGSFLWEMAGETTRPSINDQITTGNAGSLIGEALFRMSALVLEDAGDKKGGWHGLAAAAISPPTAFNRLAFGDRFDTIFPGHKPATLWRLKLGASLGIQESNMGRKTSNHDTDVIADFSMAYGLPGKPGYTYKRPMDYFDFQFATRARFGNIIEAVNIRGLLLGSDYQWGSDYRGVWGLYGSYDYITPHLYRVSSTALSLGTTGQYWAAPGVALQGSIIGGLGFGAAGTDTETIDGRGYHYGATPQGVIALALLFGDRAILEVTGRGYYVTRVGPDYTPGSELLFRGNAGLTVRLSGNHAVTVQYSESLRDTNYDNLPVVHHSEGTIGLAYTFLSDIRLGAVEWRSSGQ